MSEAVMDREGLLVLILSTYLSPQMTIEKLKKKGRQPKFKVD